MFKMAVSDVDDTTESSNEEKEKPHVQLVRADAIAFRLSLATALWGILKILSDASTNVRPMLLTSSAEAFGKSEGQVEVPEGVQLFIVSALIFVFKMSISDADDTKEGTEEKDLEKG